MHMHIKYACNNNPKRGSEFGGEWGTYTILNLHVFTYYNFIFWMTHAIKVLNMRHLE